MSNTSWAVVVVECGVCFVILVVSAVSKTSEYLDYPFIYKLIVSVNKYGFDLPAISVCTERNAFFDKQKVIKKFNLTEDWIKWEESVEEEFNNRFEGCLREIDYLNKDFFWYSPNLCFHLKNERNYNLSQFFKTYEEIIQKNFSFDEMKSLTISAKELFKCKTKKFNLMNLYFILLLLIILNM